MGEKSLEELWDDAAKRFEQRTSNTLKLKPPKTLEAVRKEIESRAEPTNAEGSVNNLDHAKQIGFNILSCLKILGGVAAQGASMAFQPADMVFNAMSLLLDVPQKVHGFHVAIDEVFVIVSPSLGQFKIYERIEMFYDIDPALNRAIHTVMISLVDICALVMTLQHGGKWRKFKSAAKKALLDDDSGLSAEIKRFTQAIEGQQSIQATLTLEAALSNKSNISAILGKAFETGKRVDEIAIGVTALREAENKRTAEQTKQSNLSKIREKLSVDEKALKTSKEMCDRLWHWSVENSGGWLEAIDTYTSWADVDSANAPPLLFLLGERHSGRSTTVSTIIHNLRAKYNASMERSGKVLVAHYFFPPMSRKLEEEDKHPAATALKHIAVQLAEQDIAIAKTMAAICEEQTDGTYFKDANCKTLWQDLRLGQPRGDATYYFIFDGVDSVSEAHAEAAAQFLDILETSHRSKPKSGEKLRVRLLVSGRSDALKRGEVKEAPSIDIEAFNSPDIERYIERELSKHDLFQGTDSEDTRKRKKICGRLLEDAKGNFFKVQSALSSIKDLVDSNGQESELDAILNEPDWDKQTISENAVAELQDQLRPRDIEEVNELLIWVKYGFSWFGVPELEAALFLRFEAAPLQKLGKKLEDKYARLFEVDASRVMVRRSLEELVVKEKKENGTAEDDTPRITATITITKADITTVQNFLWDLFQKSVTEKFEFEPLSGQTSRTKNEIQVNEKDAHLRIVMQALNFIMKSPDERTEKIGRYLVGYLPDHLRMLKGSGTVEMLSESDKRAIGGMLFDIFESGDLVERHWVHFEESEWFGMASRIDTFLKWLRDPDVVGHLGRLEKAWLKRVVSGPNPHRRLLFPMAQKLGQKWLQDRERSSWEAFSCLSRYLNLEAPDKSDSTSHERIVIFRSENDTKAIKKAEAWCKEVFEDHQGQSLWHERVGVTALEAREFKFAIEKFKHAIELPAPSWKCYRGLALAHYGVDEIEQACSSSEKALEILHGMDSPDRIELRKICMELAEWYSKLQQTERAIACYQKALEVDPDHEDAHYGILKARLTSGLKDSALDLLESMSKDRRKEDGISRLATGLILLSKDMENYEMYFGVALSLAASREGALSAVLASLDEAIRHSSQDTLLSFQHIVLRYFKGLSLYHFDPKEELQSFDSALALFDGCHAELSRKIEDEGANADFECRWLDGRAISAIICHHFRLATRPEALATDIEQFLKSAATYRISYDDRISPADSYVGAYHFLRGDREAARAHFRRYMRTAFELLTDNIDENDADGYFIMFQCLLHSGDDVDARIAFELTGPKEKTVDVRLAEIVGEHKDLARSVLEFVRRMNTPDAGPVQRYKTALDELQRRIKRLENRVEEAATIPDADTTGDAATPDVNTVDVKAAAPADVTAGAIGGGHPSDAVNNDNMSIASHDDSLDDDSLGHDDLKAAIEGYRKIHATLSAKPPLLLESSGEQPPAGTTAEPYTPTSDDVRVEWGYNCAGLCGGQWSFDNDMEICKYCWDTAFCQKCFQRQVGGEVRMFACDPKHEWLHVPRWNLRESTGPRDGTVEMGGEIVGGKHVGGRKVKIGEWLGAVWKEWNIE